MPSQKPNLEKAILDIKNRTSVPLPVIGRTQIAKSGRRDTAFLLEVVEHLQSTLARISTYRSDIHNDNAKKGEKKRLIHAGDVPIIEAEAADAITHVDKLAMKYNDGGFDSN
jgi:hypothetical protein